MSSLPHLSSKISFRTDVYIRRVATRWQSTWLFLLAILSARLSLLHNLSLWSMVTSSNKMWPLMCWPWLIFFMHSVLPDIYLFDIHQHVSLTRAKIFFYESCLPSALRAASHRRGAQRTVVEWMKLRKQLSVKL